ncbi:MAG TPA: TIGR02556 family CRISPR-associated protein [bacterium]|nr:TIGR02556 family CRISPR-associated protein [bacterium]HPN43937.1 TIGR02556 family CRISPR-associated protein [bacterium]
MLHTIAQIGKIVSAQSKGDDIFEFLVPDSTKFKSIIKINFDTENSKLEIDLEKSTNQDTLSKEILLQYLYMPSDKGNRPQYQASSTNLSYLLSQIIPNLFLFIENGELKNILNRAIQLFFVETEKPKDAKYGKIVNDKFLKEYDVKFINSKNEKIKVNIENYAEQIDFKIREKYNLRPNEYFYTLFIDNKPIVNYEDYKNFILHKNLDEAFEDDNDVHEQYCSICGNIAKATQNTTRFQLKFYMIDKINFASHFDKTNFFKSVSLCQDCYKYVLLGENWINKNLRTRLGGFELYILPHFVFPLENSENLYHIINQVPKDFNEIKNYKSIQQLEYKSLVLSRQNPFLINFMFYKKSQSAFKILLLFKDVPPTRLLEIEKVLNQIICIKNNLQLSSIDFSLELIYWLIPLKKKGADLLELRKLLQFYNSIFCDFPIDQNILFKFYCELAHIHHFQTYYIYQISHSDNPNITLVYDTIKWNFFLLFLSKLNLINGGQYMENNTLEKYYPEGIADFFRQMNYNCVQQGLALLGYVLGAVAYAQYKEGLSNKPVLDKINYQGMTDEKIVRLFNSLFEKIRQYKQHIGFAERWWSVAKQNYEAGNNITLSSDERVFYLLSGYALNTLHTRKDSTFEENNNDKQE